MIVYRFTESIDPPAPFVRARIREPIVGTEVLDFLGLIDTGADRTVLPSFVIEALELGVDSDISFQGFGSEILSLPVYLVELGVHDLPYVVTRVVLGQNESHAILGRDILNRHRIVLDGPKLRLEIE